MAPEIKVKVVPLRRMFALPSRRKVCITSDWHALVLPDWTLLAIHGVRHFSGPFFLVNRTKAAAPSSSWIFSARHTNEVGGASSRHVP